MSARRYRPRVADNVEAVHWIDERDQGGFGPRYGAAAIVEWIKSQGVEASFVEGYRIPEGFGARQPDEIVIKAAGVPGGGTRQVRRLRRADPVGLPGRE